MSIGLATKLKLQRTQRIDFLGLPGLRQQRRREKLDRIWRHTYRIVIAFVLLGIGFIVGYNTRINVTEAQRRAEVVQDMGWKRAAMLIPVGKRKCAVDWREGCLVCEHRSLSGTIRSTMC